MLSLLLVGAAACGLAFLAYQGSERLGRKALVPMACRAVAWAAIGVLLLNVSCPAPGRRATPLVLLDASISMGTAGGRWAEARKVADSLGEVRRFGDERAAGDTAPAAGRSLLAPALVAASASGRPVVVVSDGEIEDAPELPADLLAHAGVRLLPRAAVPDVAITAVSGPAQVVVGDTLVLEADVRATAGAAADSAGVEVLSGSTRLGGARAALTGGSGRVRLRLPTAGLTAGERLLRVRLTGVHDAVPDDDERLHLLGVSATPGAVLLAAPADWDARFLFRTVREVAALPLKGYVRLGPDQWRSMTDLAPVNEADVRRAAAGADLLLLKGAAAGLAKDARARGVLLWPSGEGGEAVIAGDWYLTGGGSSPLAGALLGAPTDSFPPAVQVTPIQPAPEDWVGLTAQEGRRGAPRPVVTGRAEGRVRRMTVSVDGLWRWAFRGGSSEQAYRSLIGASVSWLLGGADSARGAARPLRPVVQRGRAVTFEWVATGAPKPLAIRLAATGSARTDTLRFDGSGRAVLHLAPGEYRYTLEGGGAGLVAVERYSDELLPRPVRLANQPLPDTLVPQHSVARDWLWLFGLAVAALAGEWLSRRRLGLR